MSTGQTTSFRIKLICIIRMLNTEDNYDIKTGKGNVAVGKRQNDCKTITNNNRQL